MKKSSLLAISLASLVGLVSCGKESSAVSPKELDAKCAKIVYKQFLGGGRAQPLTAKLSYKRHLEVYGSYAVDDEGQPMEEGAYESWFECQIRYDSESYSWSVDPLEGEEWTEEEIEWAQGVIDEDSGLQYTVSDLAYFTASSCEYDAEKDKMTCTYFQEMSEDYKEPGYGFSVSVNPLGWGFTFSGSGDDSETDPETGEVTPATLTWKGKMADAYTYDKNGFMTGYVSKYQEVDKGIEDPSLDGKIIDNISFKVKYLTYVEE